MSDDLPELMGLAELHRFLADQGHPCSRQLLNYRALHHGLGTMVGGRYLVTKSQALAELERLKGRGTLRRT